MEEIEKLKSELAAAQATLATKDEQIAGMSQELSGDRSKRQTLEGERDAMAARVKELESKLNGNVPNVEEAVQKVLSERDRIQAEANRTSAESIFKSRPEFTKEADPGEVKFNAVKKKLAQFNTNNLRTVEEFVSVWEDALRLANSTTQTQTHSRSTQDAFSSGGGGGGPRVVNTTSLSAEERSVVQRMGWTDEQFIKQKTKRPQYVESLMRNLRS